MAAADDVHNLPRGLAGQHVDPSWPFAALPAADAAALDADAVDVARFLS